MTLFQFTSLSFILNNNHKYVILSFLKFNFASSGHLETIYTFSPFSSLESRLEGWHWCSYRFVSLFLFIIIAKHYYVYFFIFLKVGVWLFSREVYAKHLQEVVICYLLSICFILIFLPHILIFSYMFAKQSYAPSSIRQSRYVC